jgi:hypothetical protein
MRACRFAQRMNLAMSCYPILTPYPGTAFYDRFEREGRLRTRDWLRYNGASVVFEPKQMSAKELRHAQMAAFAEFFSPRSALRRLRLFPLKSRAWVANLAIWKGIRYYYGQKGRQVPRFRDFLDRDARAWDYPDEEWAETCAAPGGRRALWLPADQERTDEQGGEPANLEAVALAAAAASNPIVQMAGAFANETGEVDL